MKPFPNKAAREECLAEVERLVQAPQREIICELGAAVLEYPCPPGVRFSAPHESWGKRFWRSLEYEIHPLLCCDGKPQEWVSECIAGDIRNLSVGIITALVSTLGLTLAIAVPASALVIKKGVVAFCAKTPRVAPKQSVKDLLEESREHWKGWLVASVERARAELKSAEKDLKEFLGSTEGGEEEQ